MENVQIFDVIVVSLIVLLGLKGLFRGFIKEFFALFGIVGGVFVASRVASQVGDIVNNVLHFDNNNTVLLVGFVVSIASFWVLAYLIGAVISKVFSASGLGIFDRLLGFAFGAGKVFLLFSIIAYALSSVEAINKKLDERLKKSIVFPILKSSGKVIIKLDTTKLEKATTKKVNSAIQMTKDGLNKVSTEVIKQKAQEIKEDIAKKIEKDTKE